MLKKRFLMLSLIITALLLVSCGSADKKGGGNMPATLPEVMDVVYKNAELEQDFRDSMDSFDSGEIPADSAEYLIGTSDVEYTESFYSMPMMTAVAYQCILLRLPEGADVEAAKQAIADNADPRKWVCVEAESIIVENVGNVVLFVMADSKTANALQTAFLALGGK